MPQSYTVLPGDFLAKIAANFKFGSYATIWNDGSNSDLKSQRKNPNILFAGDQVTAADGTTTGTPADVVQIPDKQQHLQETLATEKTHKFVAQIDHVDLHVIIKDENDKPITGMQCTCPADGDSATSDGSGQVDALDIGTSIDMGVLSFTYKTIDLSTRGTDPDPSAAAPPSPPNPDSDPDPPPDPNAQPFFPPGDFKVQRSYELAIGYLDPLEQVTGVQARLNNLGYWAGDLGFADQDALAVQVAIEEFEVDHKATVTGDPTDAGMQQKLKTEHGC